MDSQIKQAFATTATCPACGLLCDDVSPEAITCQKGKTFFMQAVGSTQAKIKGKNASLNEAITEAARLLAKAKQPLFAGLSTDISGFRAVYQLAEKTNGTCQHINHTSSQRNMRVLQNTGWQTTTLTEVKNHADLILCIGTDIVSHNPRFFERFVNVEGMFAGGKISQREVIYLGIEQGEFACKISALPEVLAALHALVLGKTLKAEAVAGLKIADLQTLADKLKAAKYAVLTWIAKDLDFPHAELAIEQITQIVAALNQTTRAAGLPLGGSDGDTSINYAHTWLNGKILPASPDAQPDLQIWVNSFSPDAPPSLCHMPTIILGHAHTTWCEHADVFIPVATPGLDCGGTLFRVDGSVTLPLKKVREGNFPTLAEVAQQIEAQLK